MPRNNDVVRVFGLHYLRRHIWSDSRWAIGVGSITITLVLLALGLWLLDGHIH